MAACKATLFFKGYAYAITFLLVSLQTWIVNCENNIFPEKCGVKPPVESSEGFQAQLGEFPWTVRLKYGSEGHFACNGFIIHEKFVLSAAQCLSEYQGVLNLTQIDIGEYDASKEDDCLGKKCAPKVQSVKFDDPILHPDYDRYNKEYDVAVIPLKEAVKFNDYVSPVCLVTDESLKTAKIESYTLAGWGRSPPEFVDLSPIKQKLKEPLFDFHQCREMYQDLNITITDTHLCAAGPHSCASVSGAPLMFLSEEKWHAVGIVSFGVSQCKDVQLPTVYTNLHKVQAWIQETVNNYIKNH